MTEERQQTAVIIEDDPEIRELVVEVFESAGLRTIAVDNGIDGVEAVRTHDPSVTTLDINMNGIDGLETARRIRSISTTFIIMLSGLGEETDIVLGLGAGADEYVVKPFRPRELRARIEAALRRPRIESAALRPPAPDAHLNPPQSVTPEPLSQSPATSSFPGEADLWVAHRDLRLNAATRTALIADAEVELTRTEFDLLVTLIESKRRVRSKSDLTLVLRGEEAATSYYVGEADKRAVEAHMANLRRKLGDNAADPRYIETVRGVGYRLTP
ncbi:response regulator transcription factor [Microbacterium sp. zg.B48]|uniref:response regulator transcription factor n=1 Tax=unclassified Microbacterium TaxID=2609290 RepID=UPI00214AAB0E|nr:MULTISPECIES: response regulator transcription factor [unclassified Microbacterium]MCR2763279.1 response regulator transcription factor [Microbacterium sp. zg.B48]MCR2808868.1 response regulator transcription factor [Microbacterium sp. zg.B185]WIM18714.1 response regulator transcription factor [Microbacterium sp. zg-B185]